MPGKKRTEQQFEDLSSYSSSADLKRHRKSRRSLTGGKTAALVVFSLLILVGLGMIYLSMSRSDGLKTTAITKDPERLGISASTLSSESVTNIAVFGLDARTDSFSGNSDMILIFTVDNKHEKIKMTSILRDSRVSIEGETVSGEHIDWNSKINAAYQEGGPELAIRTLNRNYGLDIKDYVAVNFSNMAAIVDAFGGVEVWLTAEEVREINKNLYTLSQDVEVQKAKDRQAGVEREYPVVLQEDYIPDNSGQININSGNYSGGVFHLNGNRAVAYGRIRTLGGDAVRADRQQILLNLLLGRLMDMGLSDYSSLAREMLPLCQTSLNLSGILSLTPILTRGFALEAVTIPDAAYETDLSDGPGEDGISYLTYDLGAASRRLSSFLYEEDSNDWESYGDTGRNAVRSGTLE